MNRCATLLLALPLGTGVTSCGDQSPASPTTLNMPVTVTFSGLTANRSPVSTYVENGFTVTTVSAAWMAVATYGNPAPSLQFGSPADWEIKITAARGEPAERVRFQ
jgi:hypothetical protein